MKIRSASAVVAAAAVVVALVDGMGGPAAASAGSVLRVSQDASSQVSILQGTTLRAGLVRIDVTSDFSAGDVEIFQLVRATLAEMDVKIAEAGQGGATAAAAMQWFNTHTRFFGGLSAAPGAVSYRTVLGAGYYYVAQVNAPSATARKFQVVGGTNAHPPATDQSVLMVEPDAFAVNGPSGSLRAGPITVANQSHELHFVRFVQVETGTTDADVSAWFAGGPDPTLPGGQTLYFGTQSPGRRAVVDLSLPSGTYMLLDFIPDDQTGVPHAFTGMHTVVDVG